MRTLLVLLALVVIVGAALLYTGMIRLPLERAGAVSVQAPKIGVEVGRIAVGTENRTVTVPTLQVERAAGAENSTAH